jgi:hypothetical protein
MCLALDIDENFVRMIDQSKAFRGYSRRNFERQMIDCLHLPLWIPPHMLLFTIERGLVMSLAGDPYLQRFDEVHFRGAAIKGWLGHFMAG